MLPSLSLQTPLLHIVLPHRNCSAEELSVTAMFDRLLAASELLCGGNAPFRTLTSYKPVMDSFRTANNSSGVGQSGF
jgi:hypothetical protein